MEDRFRFDPSKGMDPADRQNLIHRFQPKMRPVERELRIGIESLNQVRQKILQNRSRYRPMVERSARELAQAAADLEVFTILKRP
jgi:DNA-binding helix-hairpin-helix protein with protein kinase domain